MWSHTHTRAHTQLHEALQQLRALINLQAPSQWPPSFEWHFRVQAEITSTTTKLTWSSFFLSEVLFGSRVCVCVCVWGVVYVRRISFLYRFGGLRGTQAHSGESIWDIYYALHQSFWTLDISLAEQIVSYQNSISEMTCRNSLLRPPRSPSSSSSLARSSSPRSASACISERLPAWRSWDFSPNKFAHLCARVEWIHMRPNEVHFSLPQLHPTFRQ